MIIIYHHDHFIIKDLYAYDRLVKNCIGGISFGVWISSYGYKAVKKGRLHPQMLWFFCKAKLAIRNLPYLQSFLPSLFAYLFYLFNQISQMFQRQQTEL